MSGLGHENITTEVDCPIAAAVRARWGLILFTIYLSFYGAFVGINAFAPDMMSTEMVGMNLAVVYGFALIAAALALAVVYAVICARVKEGSF